MGDEDNREACGIFVTPPNSCAEDEGYRAFIDEDCEIQCRQPIIGINPADAPDGYDPDLPSDQTTTTTTDE